MSGHIIQKVFVETDLHCGGEAVRFLLSQITVSRKKEYHGVRVPGSKKRTSVYSQFLPKVCHEWNLITEQCYSARSFERKIKKAFE